MCGGGLVTSIVGLCLSVGARKKGNNEGITNAGFVINLISLILSILIIVLAVSCVACASMLPTDGFDVSGFDYMSAIASMCHLF